VVAPDLLEPEVCAGQLSLYLGIPMLRPALHGDTLVATVRSFDGTPEGACPVCHFGEAAWNDLHRQTRFSCDLSDPRSHVPSSAGVVTRSFGALCGMAANLAVLEVVRRVLGIGETPGARLVEYCGFTHATTVSALPRREDCRGDHRRLERAVAPEGLALDQVPLGALLEAGGMDPARCDELSARIDHVPFVETALCGCRVERFRLPGEALGACSRCGVARVPHPFTLHDEVPGELLAPHLDRSLASLGAPGVRALVLHGRERSALVTAANP
jgi:hypothetical protein